MLVKSLAHLPSSSWIVSTSTTESFSLMNVKQRKDLRVSKKMSLSPAEPEEIDLLNQESTEKHTENAL